MFENKNMRVATVLALSTAVISGISNFINKEALASFKDPILFASLKNIMVGLFLIAIIFATGKFKEIATLNKKSLIKLFTIGVVGGSVPFALFFVGLSKIPAINASLIHKTLFVWVVFLAVPFLKERISAMQAVGMVSIFCANILVGGFNGFLYNTGELMIFGATILWAVENIVAKFALKEISSEVVATARMSLGALVLVPIAMWHGSNFPAINAISAIQWQWLVITSILLLGYVLTWYAALKRAPAIYVATLLVPATLVTNILSAMFVTKSLQLMPIISSVLFAIGIYAVIRFTKTTTPAQPKNSVSPSLV